MASYGGTVVAASQLVRAEIPGVADEANFGATVGRKPLVDDPAALAPPVFGPSTDDSDPAAVSPTGYLGTVGESSTPGLDFYERFHVIPRAIDLGNVLTTTTVAMEVFSAFRDDTEFWLAFDNNAGEGVSLSGAPTLPIAVAPMAGFLFDVVIELTGPAVVDATLDFTFSDTGVIVVPITLQRVVMLQVPPEMPYEETLEWLTDVLIKVDGAEQRRALRKNPRQHFSWDLLVEDGPERSLLENILFDWQSRTFGLPVWHEATELAGTVTASVTTVITVASTADADYRDDELVVIWESPTKFDVLNLVSHTSTTLTVLNPPANSYAATPSGLVLVAPLRLGVIDGDVRGSRYRTGVERLRARFRVKDNDSDLADTSTWSTFNSKVLLDDSNFVEGTMAEEYDHPVTRVDGRVGVTSEYSRQDRHRRASVRRFVTSSKAGLWRVRKLLHAFRGRQVSLYLPTFSSDLTPIGTMTSGASVLAITNVGYTNFVRNRQPKAVIRVVPVTGAAFIRTITGSTIIDATQENITVDSAWPSTLTPAQIDKIMFVEKVRSDSDAIRISHERGTRRVVTMPVRTVLE